MLHLCRQAVLQTTTTHSRRIKMVKTQLRKSGQFWAQIAEKRCGSTWCEGFSCVDTHYWSRLITEIFLPLYIGWRKSRLTKTRCLTKERPCQLTLESPCILKKYKCLRRQNTQKGAFSLNFLQTSHNYPCNTEFPSTDKNNVTKFQTSDVAILPRVNYRYQNLARRKWSFQASAAV